MSLPAAPKVPPQVAEQAVRWLVAAAVRR
ncbi:hypothetical protein NAG22_26975, partial [Pseudomonas aeruginosa]|nr:hypothetical protein [Pseudomonas aeruginosa]